MRVGVWEGRKVVDGSGVPATVGGSVVMAGGEEAVGNTCTEKLQAWSKSVTNTRLMSNPTELRDSMALSLGAVATCIYNDPWMAPL